MWSLRKRVTCFVSLILHLHWIGALHAAPPMSPMQRMQPIFPDSNELYSYVSPRTIADLKNEHARQAMMDVTDTINEVQRILSKDPSLPRLTRGEIEDLFEMVTREEYKRSLAAGDFDRAKHMRSLMLVLPYNTNSADESLEDLYTRPPVTKMVNSEMKKPKPQRIVLPPVTGDMSAAHSDINNHRIATTYKPNFVPNARSTYTAPVTTFHPRSTMQIMQAQNHALVNEVSTYHPVVKKQSVAVTRQAFVDPPKTTMQTMSRTSLFDSNKFSSHYSAAAKPFTAPSATAVMRPNVKDLLATIGLQPESTAPSPTTAEPSTTISRRISTVSTTRKKHSTPTPTTTTTSTTTNTPRTTITTTTTPKPELTPELKDLLKEFGLLTNEEPPSHYTAGPYQDEFQPIVPSSLRDETLHVNEFKPLPASLLPTMSASLAPPKRQKLMPEIRSDDFSSFKPLPIPDDVPPPTDSELEDLLKSYGLLDGQTSRNSKSLTADNRDESDSTTEAPPKSSKIPKMMNVPEVNVEFLSPDLMQVLGDMGVKAEPKQKSTTTTAKPPKTTQSYPFPSESTASSATTQNDYEKLHLLLDTIKELDNLNANLTDDELDSLNLRHFNFSEELLAQGPDPIDDYYSYDVRKNEIKRRQSDAEDEELIETTTSATANNEPLKVSLNLSDTPSSTAAANGEDDDSATTTSPDSGTITTTVSSASPNEGRSNNLATGDDEESSTASADENKDTTTTTTSEPTSSTTEESRNGSIQDLRDSFGGDSGLDPVSDEAAQLPAPKRNGFYFFSDWNSFLEVGEDPEKIVVRFDPKVGDSRVFVPVKIP